MQTAPNSVPRRSPETVMRLARMGSLHQCRLSFMRQLTRRIATEKWQFTRPVFSINDQGFGHAVYCANFPEGKASLVAFAHDLPDELRSDRGRVSAKELTLSRANRSVRLWNHVVERLADGAQPDADTLHQVGYLMRTTAVYGSGKFGAADREQITQKSLYSAPFSAEMLTVYLIRTFVRDLINHVAEQKGGTNAVTLDADLARSLGIGNSTGLGMAPFLINHPVLLNNWVAAREEAISRVRSIELVKREDINTVLTLMRRMQLLIRRWRSEHPVQQSKLHELKTDAIKIIDQLSNAPHHGSHYWDQLTHWASANLSMEGQECIASLMLEPYPQLVDGLADCMADEHSQHQRIDGRTTVADTIAQLKSSFAWVDDIDWQEQDATARAWYVSAEKLEPRLGERYAEPIADYAQPLAPAHAVQRAQWASFAPYGEIRDNTISASLFPVDMLRAKLSFFGATRFDPRSDRWVRICLYAGAPYPDELGNNNADDWIYPHL